MAIGDRIRMTRGDNDFKNGDVVRVVGRAGEIVSVRNSSAVKSFFDAFSNPYADTNQFRFYGFLSALLETRHPVENGL